MVVLLVKFFTKIFGQLIRWCLYVIDYWSDGFIFFVCSDQGIKFWCHGFHL